MSNQKMIIALLGVVAVLLAVIVGVLVLKPTAGSNDVAAVPNSTAVTPNTNTGSTSGAPTGMGGSTATGPFDAKTATKVPAGTTPKDFVDQYYKAIEKGDYATAFKHLPKDKQAQGEQAFADQLKGYGMNAHTMGQVTEKGNEMVVNATAQTSGGPFPYTWTFVKSGDTWLVKARAIGGMGQ